VGATVVSYKEFAVAGIGTVVEGHMVIVVVAMKSKVEFVEKETITLFRIASCLLSLADQSVVHRLFSFQDLK
jgi:hypothetical protein